MYHDAWTMSGKRTKLNAFTSEGSVETMGYQVIIHGYEEFVIYVTRPLDSEGWTMTEYATGMRCGRNGDTRIEAITKTIEMWERGKITVDRFRDTLKKAIKAHGRVNE